GTGSASARARPLAPPRTWAPFRAAPFSLRTTAVRSSLIRRSLMGSRAREAGMSGYLEVARTSLTAVLLHPLRSLVTTACIVAVFLPWLTCFALSEGIRLDAEAAVRFGADLYVTTNQFGRSGPVPVGLAEEVRKIEGVTEVTPRIVGSILLGKDNER